MIYQSHEEFVELKNSLPQAELENRLRLRQKVTGAVKLIGQLFNVGFLNLKIQQLCMQTFLRSSKKPSELDIECFHILITTIGAKIEEQPSGAQLVDEYLATLEDIIDRSAESYSLRLRYMILDIFELRARKWNIEHEETALPASITMSSALIQQDRENSELLEKMKIIRAFLNELNTVLGGIEGLQLFIVMERLKKKYFDSQDLLEGTVKIIFERAIEAQEFLSFALICKGLANIQAPTDRTVTFKTILMSLCQLEIESQRKRATIFRQFHEQFRALKCEENVNKALKMKAAYEFTLKLQSRFHRFASFYGELFNVDLIESRLIFEFLIMLLTPEAISNTSIECFCLLLPLVAPKMLKEKNCNILIKDNIMKLNEASKYVKLSQRVSFLIEDVMTFARIQLKLPFGFMKNQVSITRPLSSTMSNESFWTAFRKKKLQPLQQPIKQEEKSEVKQISSYPKHSLIKSSSLPPIPPRHWTYQLAMDESYRPNLTFAPFAIHQNIISQITQRQINSMSASDENNNVDKNLQPIEFA